MTAANLHERHMGFELEIAHAKIVRLLQREPRDVEAIIEVIKHLKPRSLRRAVADTIGASWAA